MKIRIIRKPDFMYVCHLQVKRWWLPVWLTVLADNEAVCIKAAEELLKHGNSYTVLHEMES